MILRRPYLKTAVLATLLFLAMPQPGLRAASPAVDSLCSRFSVYASWCTPEKVYLHIDRTCYTAGETVWFMGWVQDANENTTLPRSQFLYAELLNEKGDAVTRVKIKRDQTGYPGAIDLSSDLKTGDYTLRGYTRWQLNNKPEYLFNQKVHIIGSDAKASGKPASASQVEELTFWPESGRYFPTHKAVIGFKALDKQGRSIDFNGTLVSEDGAEEFPVSTIHDGMGIISFIPRPVMRYSVKDASGRRWALPRPANEGAIIHLQQRGERFYISAVGLGDGDASLLVRDLCELRPLANLPLNGNQKSLVVARSSFRPGINHLLAVDEKGRILAERLFYVEDPQAPVCQLQMLRFMNDTRTLSRGVIALKGPDGAALNGNCSVSVVRSSLKDWQQADGITSYMGLSSELSGRINNPYYYFDPDVPAAERRIALDALMIIQGWRYYDLEQILNPKGGSFSLKHVREQWQEVRGRISRKASGKMPKKFTFTFMIPRKNVYNSLHVNEANRFVIDSIDFQEGTEFLINIGKSRLITTYLPTWDGDVLAKPYVYIPAPGLARNTDVTIPFDAPASDDTLSAAVVSAESKPVEILTFGNDYTPDLKRFSELTLIEYLTIKKSYFKYDGEYMLNRSQRILSSFDSLGELEEESAELFSGEEGSQQKGQVKLLVDEQEQPWWAYDMIQLNEIKTISVSTEPDPIYGGSGGIVAITLKGIGKRSSKARNPSLLYFVPLGYQTPRRFESPRYDRGYTTVVPDKRNTVWWSPEVQVSGGRAVIEFCNTDQLDFPFYVRIEGISADGRPFSRHCRIAPKGL